MPGRLASSQPRSHSGSPQRGAAQAARGRRSRRARREGARPRAGVREDDGRPRPRGVRRRSSPRRRCSSGAACCAAARPWPRAGSRSSTARRRRSRGSRRRVEVIDSGSARAQPRAGVRPGRQAHRHVHLDLAAREGRRVAGRARQRLPALRVPVTRAGQLLEREGRDDGAGARLPRLRRGVPARGSSRCADCGGELELRVLDEDGNPIRRRGAPADAAAPRPCGSSGGSCS